MKSPILRAIVLFGILATATMMFSSCNKGYGCPNEFSIGMTVDRVDVDPAC